MNNNLTNTICTYKEQQDYIRKISLSESNSLDEAYNFGISNTENITMERLRNYLSPIVTLIELINTFEQNQSNDLLYYIYKANDCANESVNKILNIYSKNNNDIRQNME